VRLRQLLDRVAFPPLRQVTEFPTGDPVRRGCRGCHVLFLLFSSQIVAACTIFAYPAFRPTDCEAIPSRVDLFDACIPCRCRRVMFNREPVFECSGLCVFLLGRDLSTVDSASLLSENLCLSCLLSNSYWPAVGKRLFVRFFSVFFI